MEDVLATQEGVEAVAPESAPETNEVTPTTEVTEQVSSDVVDDSIEALETPEDKGSAPTKAVKELIEQRKKRQKAEQEAAYWRGQAEARATTTEPPKVNQPVQQGPPQVPVLDNYETFEEYEKAKDEYLIQAAEHRLIQRITQQQKQGKQQSMAEAFEQRLVEAAKEDPTIEEIRNDPTLPVSQTMAQLLQRTEQAPQLLKWLNNNRTDATKIAKMDPISAAMEFGRIEANLKSAPKAAPIKKVSAAPAPIATVQASTPSSIDEDDLPMTEYYKRRTKQLYGR